MLKQLAWVSFDTSLYPLVLADDGTLGNSGTSGETWSSSASIRESVSDSENATALESLWRK